MQPASGALDDDTYNEENNEYDIDHEEEDEEEEEDQDDDDCDHMVTEIISRRQRSTKPGQTLEELFVRQQGYSRPSWISTGELIEKRLLSLATLRAFERKQQSTQQKKQPAKPTAPPKAKPQPVIQKKDEKITNSEDGVAAAAEAERNNTLLYPQRDRDYEEDSLRFELAENATLAKIISSQLGQDELKDVLIKRQHGTKSCTLIITNYWIRRIR